MVRASPRPSAPDVKFDARAVLPLNEICARGDRAHAGLSRMVNAAIETPRRVPTGLPAAPRAARVPLRLPHPLSVACCPWRRSLSARSNATTRSDAAAASHPPCSSAFASTHQTPVDDVPFGLPGTVGDSGGPASSRISITASPLSPRRPAIELTNVLSSAALRASARSRSRSMAIVSWLEMIEPTFVSKLRSEFFMTVSSAARPSAASLRIVSVLPETSRWRSFMSSFISSTPFDACRVAPASPVTSFFSPSFCFSSTPFAAPSFSTSPRIPSILAAAAVSRAAAAFSITFSCPCRSVIASEPPLPPVSAVSTPAFTARSFTWASSLPTMTVYSTPSSVRPSTSFSHSFTSAATFSRTCSTSSSFTSIVIVPPENLSAFASRPRDA